MAQCSPLTNVASFSFELTNQLLVASCSGRLNATLNVLPQSLTVSSRNLCHGFATISIHSTHFFNFLMVVIYNYDSRIY